MLINFQIKKVAIKNFLLSLLMLSFCGSAFGTYPSNRNKIRYYLKLVSKNGKRVPAFNETNVIYLGEFYDDLGQINYFPVTNEREALSLLTEQETKMHDVVWCKLPLTVPE